MFSRHLLIVAVVGLFSSAIHADTIYVDDNASAGGDGAGGNTAYRALADALTAAAHGGIGNIAVGQGECGTVLTPEQAVWALILEQAGAYELPDGVALGIHVEVPLTFHVVRTTAGTGEISESQLSQALVDADAAFASMGISFCLPGPTIYIDSDEFYFDIDTGAEIDALRSIDPVPNTVNIYFTENLAWEGGPICGISSFTFATVQGIAMANSCTGTPENPTTFPHEIGHYFDLFHTHETMFGVECVDGSNCNVAGDWLCDTPADPNLAGQVAPPPDCLYTGGEPGPCVGDPPYDPDPTNFMSYSHLLCRDNFSPQQDARGLATLVNLRPELVDACDCPSTLSPRLYVNASAPPGGDGTSWESALDDLQQALTVAACPLSSATEIWVTGGTYTPAPPGGARGATFRLVSGVEVYGHFAGSETSVEERELANPAYETILSGDLDGDDETGGGNSENSYHVTTGSRTDQTAVLDGFTITAANANGAFTNGHGGGMHTASGSPTVKNCTFDGNRAIGDGSGMYNWGSSPTVTNCRFSGNAASDQGGGIYNYASSATVSDCVFTANTAASAGGGMYNGSSSPIITSCAFSDNSAGFGGGLFNDIASNPDLSSCNFDGNMVTGSGGGTYNESDGITLTDCTISANSANFGGGMYNEGSSPTLIGCTFTGNMAASNGGGMNNIPGSNPTLINCLFNANSAGRGGGMNNNDASPRLTQCMFTENSANFGGGMANDGDETELTNCTFSGNSAANNGGGIRNGGSTPKVSNCILWNNTPEQIFNTLSGTLEVRYSDVQGGWPGTGNIDVDPMFADADLRLSSGSPCIDAGDNTAAPDGIDTDLDGNPRFVDDPDTDDTGNGDCPVVDMGAYELQRSCDCETPPDGTVDAGDFLALLAQWGGAGPCDCEAEPDGAVDAGDFLALLAGWGSCP